MKSKTGKRLLIISNVENNDYYKHLESVLSFENDKRIIFAGTLYDQELVKKVRENAYAYIHGHSVGGTNPSLLEAMGSTKTNILFDVPFNREVGEDQCLYFDNRKNQLDTIINSLEENSIMSLDPSSIITSRYSWDFIINEYETFFNFLGKGNR